jgi:hypothetical protein
VDVGWKDELGVIKVVEADVGHGKVRAGPELLEFNGLASKLIPRGKTLF